MATIPILPGCPQSVSEAVPWDDLFGAFSCLADLSGCPQDPAFHSEGDVAIHTKMVADILVTMPTWLQLPPQEREVLYAAAILHDIGKPSTVLPVSPDNPTPGRAPSHSRVGAHMTRRLLWERGVPYNLRESVVALVRTHMRPRFVAVLDDPRSDIYRLSWLTRIDHLAILAEADTRGRIAKGIPEDLDRLAYFKEYAQLENCLSTPRQFASDHARIEFFAKKGMDPDYSPYDDTWGPVILLSGLPGSGKDHWIGHSGLTHPVISLDQIRQEFPKKPSSEIAQIAYNRAKVYLASKTPFIWNATNLNRELRGGTINLFRRYKASAKVIYVESTYEKLYSQNSDRDYKNIVPDHVLDRMLNKWDIPDLTEAHQVSAVLSAPPPKLSRRSGP